MRIYVYVDGNRFVCVGQSRMLSLKPETLFVLMKKTNKTTSYQNMQCGKGRYNKLKFPAKLYGNIFCVISILIHVLLLFIQFDFLFFCFFVKNGKKKWFELHAILSFSLPFFLLALYCLYKCKY